MIFNVYKCFESICKVLFDSLIFIKFLQKTTFYTRRVRLRKYTYKDNIIQRMNFKK